MSATLTQPHQITRYQLAALIARVKLAQAFGQRCTRELENARTLWNCKGRNAADILGQLEAIRADVDQHADAGDLAPQLLRAMFHLYPATQLARYIDPDLTPDDLEQIARVAQVDPLQLHGAWHEAGRNKYGWRS